MELTRKHQRLGDMIAGTTVIKKHSLAAVQYPVTMAVIASASGRLLSFIIDLIIAGALTFGYLLLLSPEEQQLSKWLLLFSPLVPFLYFVLSEPLVHSTPGKWLFGYAITHEDGSSVSLAASVIRTFVRLFDVNPLGLLSIWLSPKKQRFGDLLADTVISRQKRRWQGGAALGGWIILSSILLFFGLQNETSLIHSEFKFNFYPTIEFMGEVAEESAYKELTLTHVRFAAGDANTFRTPPVFVAGETIFIITDVYGYERSGRMVWIQEDLEIKYPDSSIGLHQENIVDYHQVVPSKSPVQLTNSIKLPESAQGGTYIVSITVRDLFGHDAAKTKQNFEVKSLISPPPQAAPAEPSLNTVPPGETLPSETEQPQNPKEGPAPSF
ncbi:MAG: RDD family protein [Deltaproteobacteria bacterium]|nr:RDD family protein [Deltaproteobacteria bacterium]